MEINEIQYTIIKRIQKSLASNDHMALEEIFNSYEIELLIDKELINTARTINAKDSVIFLTTIGCEHRPDDKFYRNLLLVSQLIKRKITTDQVINQFKGDKKEKEFFEIIIKIINKESSINNEILNYKKINVDFWFAMQCLCDANIPSPVIDLLTIWSESDKSLKPWLMCSKLIIERSEFIKAKALKNEYGNVLEKLIEIAPQNQESIKSIMQATLLDKILIPNLNREKSLKYAKKIIEKNKTIEYRSLYLRSLLINHEFQKAIEICNELIVDSIKIKTNNISSTQEKNIPKIVKDNDFDTTSAEVTLKTVNSALQSKGLKPFLISGTLLGCMRDNKIMPHDKDIDIGLIGWEAQFDLATTLIELGFFEINLHELSGEKLFLISAVDLRNDVTVDFFIFHERDNYFLHGIEYQDGFMQNFKFSKFDIVTHGFLNEKFYIPKQWDIMLTENYGNWKEPIKNYVVTVESPALVDKGSLKHKVIASLEVFKTIYNNLDQQRIARILTYSEEGELHLFPQNIHDTLRNWLRHANNL